MKPAAVPRVPKVSVTDREFDIVDAYLSEADQPTSQALLLLKLAGLSGLPPAGAGAAAKLPPADRWARHAVRTPYTNTLLQRHMRWHANEHQGSGARFLDFHHGFVHTYEDWRERNLFPKLLAWDPATCIPPAFAYPARVDNCPRRPLPTWATVQGGNTPDPIHGHKKLGEFRSAEELGDSIDGYHGGVHVAVGGDMALVELSPKDPVFWAWHKFLDEAVYHTWQRLQMAGSRA